MMKEQQQQQLELNFSGSSLNPKAMHFLCNVMVEQADIQTHILLGFIHSKNKNPCKVISSAHLDFLNFQR